MPDLEGTSEQASYPYKSVWMAHWMCTSCKSETKACGHVSIHYEEAQQHNQQRNHDRKKHSLSQGNREVTEPKRVREVSEGLSLTESSKKTRNERWEGQSFPMFSRPPKTGLGKQHQQTCTVHGGLLSESNPPAMPSRAAADAWPPEITPLLPERQVMHHNFLEKNSLAVSESFQDEFVRSDSRIVRHQFKGGSTSLPSFKCREEDISHCNSFLAPLQHATNTNDLTSVPDEKNINWSFISSRLGGSVSRLNDVAMLEHDPPTSSNAQAQPDFVGKKFQETQNESGPGLLPSQSSPQELTKLGKVYHGYYCLPSLQRSVLNMETGRVCSTADAEEGSSRGPAILSKTSHQFQLTKKTGVNLSEGGDQVFGQSTVSTQLKGKAFSGFFGFSPGYGVPVKSGLKLLPYRSSTDLEGDEIVRDGKAPAVESSSETDIMGMDAFQENLLPGVASSPSNKHVEGGKSPTSQSAFSSASKENGGRPYRNFLDINQELPDPATFGSSGEERDASTSRTQSLDVERLLSQSEQPANSGSNACLDGSQGLQPSSRWVKRLKLSASHSGYGTKSSKMGEASSHENVKNFSIRTVKCNITSSQPTMGQSFGKEHMALDPTATLPRNKESSSIDSARDSRNITLSHPWITRWFNKVASPNIPEPVGAFKSQCSRETVNEFQKKQFPSVGAMALMGKAMSGFHQCEVAKKGSLVVWNTK